MRKGFRVGRRSAYGEVMTDSSDSTEATADDPSSEPAYQQLGEDGNPFSTDGAGDTDAVPGKQGGGEQGVADDESQNAPLPDWGPTDGEHGVDTPAQ